MHCEAPAEEHRQAQYTPCDAPDRFPDDIVLMLHDRSPGDVGKVVGSQDLSSVVGEILGVLLWAQHR